MKNSLIQWCTHTYNPWLGCRKVAPECEKCYIVRQTPLRVRGIKHGAQRHRCVDSTLALHAMDTTHADLFDWIIFGGESEPGGEPRPFDVIDLDKALHFCRQNKIPAFVKQMGGAPVYSRDTFDDGQLVIYGWRKDVTFPGGCTIKLNGSHGAEIEQWPNRFQVREFPTEITA